MRASMIGNLSLLDMLLLSILPEGDFPVIRSTVRFHPTVKHNLWPVQSKLTLQLDEV